MSTLRKPLNLIGLTQGANIDVFLNLLELLRKESNFEFKVGCIASFYRHYKTSSVVKKKADGIKIICEWKVVEKSREKPISWSRIKEIEARLPPGTLWESIIADRRLIYGPNAKFFQDYRVRFSDDQLLAMAGQFVVEFEELLKTIQPSIVLGFEFPTMNMRRDF